MNARRSISWRRLLTLAAFLAVAAGPAQAPAESQTGSRIARGKELFVRAWSPNDEKSPKGDGLGPLFNADSCIACHAQGGIGGAGPNSVNVQLLTLIEASRPSAQVETVQVRLQKVHPAFLSGSAVNTTIVLHRHSTERGYGVWHDDLLRMKSDDQRELDPLLRLFPVQALSLFITRPRQHSPHSIPLSTDGLEFELTERNTPALFGAALVNGVTDNLLHQVARRQSQQFPGITGRVPRSIDGRVGRFGWRGQISTLQDFVQNACAVELGLQLAGRLQSASPIPAQAETFTIVDKKSEKRAAAPHVDMDAGQAMALTAYVMNLPRPKQTKPKLPGTLALSHVTGEKTFNNIGCAACHMRQVAKIDGIYSDLLLHDMGADLSDPAPAIPIGSSVSSGGYYGSSVLPITPLPPSLAELRREWRTPPLWGVRDSAPYLHDGRAQTLEEAIRAHGGEAEVVTRKFRELTAMERDTLLTFLDTLAAP